MLRVSVYTLSDYLFDQSDLEKQSISFQFSDNTSILISDYY